MHLVLEGTHGVGKTTAIERVIQRDMIAQLGAIPGFLIPWESLMALPGDRVLAYRINDVARSQAQLHAGTRPTLSDRCYASTLAFAAVAVARGVLPEHFLTDTRHWASSALERGLLVRPDRVLVLDLPGESAWGRINARGPSEWTTLEEVVALAEFYAEPPGWYLDLLTPCYELVRSGTVEANITLIESTLLNG